MTQQLTSLTVTIELYQKDRIKPSFETALTEAIDEVFTSLGENVKQATYRYLENKYEIRKEHIPKMIEGFTDAIESIFGDAARLVELKIIEKLQSKVQGFTYKPKNNEVLFAEYLMALQKYM